MISTQLANSVLADLETIKGLFAKKAEQYQGGSNDLLNFSKGALLKYGNEGRHALFETAKGYLLKHIAMLYSEGADTKPNMTESLMDIAIYALILRYMILYEGGADNAK